MNWMIIVGVLFTIGGIGNITKNIGNFFLGIAVGVVLLYFGIKKCKTKNAPNSNRELQTETFHVAGVSYCLDNIGKLANSNPEWKSTAAQIISKGKATERIFRYNYINKPVKLIPEPKNEHDENAVAVFIAGEKVGYISRNDNLHVKVIIKNREIKYISSFVSGGQYKVVSKSGDIQHQEDGISIKLKIGYV